MIRLTVHAWWKGLPTCTTTVKGQAQIDKIPAKLKQKANARDGIAKDSGSSMGPVPRYQSRLIRPIASFLATCTSAANDASPASSRLVGADAQQPAQLLLSEDYCPGGW